MDYFVVFFSGFFSLKLYHVVSRLIHENFDLGTPNHKLRFFVNNRKIMEHFVLPHSIPSWVIRVENILDVKNFRAFWPIQKFLTIKISQFTILKFLVRIKMPSF